MRKRRLMRLVAAKIREHADELAELEAREVGKPCRDAQRFDISYNRAAFDYYAGLADTLHCEIVDQGPIEARIVYEPYGVVAAILPFNWPPIHFSKKSAPALAAGNTVIIKPGEQAPLTVLRSAAENLTFATMELGGKNALLVLHDADLDVAIDVALEGMFYNQGEACTSTARMTAPEPYRLYQATVSDMWVLCPREPRQPCPLHGLAKDHRTRVPMP